jgi:hypothetical protein
MSKTLAEKLNSPGPKRISSLDGGGIKSVNLDAQRFKAKS